MGGTEMIMTSIPKDEARVLLRLLTPLSGRRIPNGKSHPISVDLVIEALESMLSEGGSLERALEADARGSGAVYDASERSSYLIDSKSSDGFEAVERRMDMAALLARLNDEQRAIVDLRFGLTTGAGHTIAEVAEITGKTRQAVEGQIARALRTMRAEHVESKREPTRTEGAVR